MALYKCSKCGKFISEEEIGDRREGKIICKTCLLKESEEIMEERLKKDTEETVVKKKKNFIIMFLIITIPVILFEIIGILLLKPKSEVFISRFNKKTVREEDLKESAVFLLYGTILDFKERKGKYPDKIDEILDSLKINREILQCIYYKNLGNDFLLKYFNKTDSIMLSFTSSGISLSEEDRNELQ